MLINFSAYGPHLPIRLNYVEIHILLGGAQELETICKIVSEFQIILLGWISPQAHLSLDLPRAFAEVMTQNYNVFSVIVDKAMSLSNEELTELMDVRSFPTTDLVHNRYVFSSYDGVTEKAILDTIAIHPSQSHQPQSSTGATMITTRHTYDGSPELSRSSVNNGQLSPARQAHRMQPDSNANVLTHNGTTNATDNTLVQAQNPLTPDNLICCSSYGLQSTQDAFPIHCYTVRRIKVYQICNMALDPRMNDCHR